MESTVQRSELKQHVPLAALVEIASVLCEDMDVEGKEVFADTELECFRECLIWLQNLHRDKKTNSKILGKAVTALTLIRPSLQNVGRLTEAE